MSSSPRPRSSEFAIASATLAATSAAQYGVAAVARRDAPGIYVDGKKLGAIGLRIRRHCSYHGLAVNVAMDLEPFGRIDPCGYEGLEVTELRALCGVDDVARFRADLTPHLLERLRLG